MDSEKVLIQRGSSILFRAAPSLSEDRQGQLRCHQCQSYLDPDQCFPSFVRFKDSLVTVSSYVIAADCEEPQRFNAPVKMHHAWYTECVGLGVDPAQMLSLQTPA